MAKVFSWKIIEGYAYIAHPEFVKDKTYPEKVCITNKELPVDEVCSISDWAYDCSYAEYEEHFNLMVSKCSAKNNFLTAREYWDAPQICNLKGPKGDQGERGYRGERGLQGPQGPIGPAGPTAIPSKTFFAFKTSENEPPKPIGGFWDPYDDTFVYPDGWSASDRLERPVWMSMKTFSEDETINEDWSLPIEISGSDGKNGVDGISKEFIYKRTKNDSYGSKPDTSQLPSENVDDYVPAHLGWTDSPQGIDEKEFHAEWVSTRKKDLKTKVWGPWSEASLWSKYGVNGMDGDGVQYIFLLNDGTVPLNPTPEDINTEEYQEIGQYEGVEYIPTHLGWSDDPKGVTKEKQFEWVCIRKYKNGKWQSYSNPSLWARFGEKGSNGYSTLSLYTMTSGTDNPPAFKENAKPSEQYNIWSKSWPLNYKKGNAVWEIVATIITNEDSLVGGTKWEGPILKTGVNGKDAVLPNFSVDVYAMSNSLPEPPTSDDPKFPGTSLNKEGETVTWIDFPNTNGKWWKCVGKVNGITNKMVMENGKPSWGAVLPHTGTQGPGIFPEFRCAKGTADYYPVIEQVRNPNGWTTSDVFVPELTDPNDVLWEISAMISYEVVDGELVGEIIKQKNGKYWQGPRRINGVQGPKGETGPIGKEGPIGISGIPGVGYRMRFCLGTLTDYDGSHILDINDIEPQGWVKERPETTELKPYIWAVQGEEIFELDKEALDPMNPYKLTKVKWGKPYRPDGVNGLDGRDGNKGQIVYPAGAYDKDKIYTCTEQSAPYVLDGDKFYIMNFIGNWQGSVQGMSPSEAAKEGNEFWVPFNSVDAIYAKVGIIPNGLIGEFVFNKQFVFSQKGVYYPDPMHPEVNYPASNYATYRSNGSEEIVAPETIYDDILNGIFVPYILMNAITGEAWFAGKEIQFKPDGGIVWGRMKNAEEAITEIENNLNNVIIPDVDYITNTFEKYGKEGSETIAKKGVILSNFIGVRDNTIPTTTDNVKAFINGSSAYGDETHGTMMFASGMNSFSQPETLYPWYCAETEEGEENIIYTELDFGSVKEGDDVEGAYGGQNDFRYYVKMGEKDFDVPHGNFSIFTRKTVKMPNFNVIKYDKSSQFYDCADVNVFPFNSYLYYVSDTVDYSGGKTINILDGTNSYISDGLQNDVFIGIGVELIDNQKRLAIYKTDVTRNGNDYTVIPENYNSCDKEDVYYYVSEVMHKGKIYDKWKYHLGHNIQILDSKKQPREIYILTPKIVKNIDALEQLKEGTYFEMEYTGDYALNPTSVSVESSTESPGDPSINYPNYYPIEKSYKYDYEIKREYWDISGIKKTLFYKRNTDIANENIEGYKIAPTKIYEDGTIFTDKLMTKKGSFQGEIEANGTFYGTLNDAGGTILNADIKNSNLYGTVTIPRGGVFRAVGDNSSTIINISNTTIEEKGSNEIIPFENFYWSRQNKDGSDTGVDCGGIKKVCSFYAVEGGTIYLPQIKLYSYMYTADKNEAIRPPWASIWIEYIRDDKTTINSTVKQMIREYTPLTETSNDKKKKWFNNLIEESSMIAPVTGYYKIYMQWFLHLNKYTWLQADKSFGSLSLSANKNVEINYSKIPKLFTIGNNGFRFSNGNGTIVSMIDDKQSGSKIELLVNAGNGQSTGFIIRPNGIEKIIKGEATIL